MQIGYEVSNGIPIFFFEDGGPSRPINPPADPYTGFGDAEPIQVPSGQAASPTEPGPVGPNKEQTPPALGGGVQRCDTAEKEYICFPIAGGQTARWPAEWCEPGDEGWWAINPPGPAVYHYDPVHKVVLDGQQADVVIEEDEQVTAVPGDASEENDTVTLSSKDMSAAQGGWVVPKFGDTLLGPNGIIARVYGKDLTRPQRNALLQVISDHPDNAYCLNSKGNPTLLRRFGCSLATRQEKGKCFPHIRMPVIATEGGE